MVLIKNTGLSSLPWKNPYSQNWKLGLSDSTPDHLCSAPSEKKHVDPPDGITPKNRPSFDQTRLSSQHRPKTLCFLRCNLLKMLTWSWRCVCVCVCYIPSWFELSFNVLCWTLTTRLAPPVGVNIKNSRSTLLAISRGSSLGRVRPNMLESVPNPNVTHTRKTYLKF